MPKSEKAAHIWDRSDKEWYVEEQRCTTQLLAVEAFDRPIWDPACGGGNILAAARDTGRTAWGTDVVMRAGPGARWTIGIVDFLKTEDGTTLPGSDIICNPPFARGVLTEAFIRHALKRPSLRKLAIFTDIKFLASSRRANGLWAEHPPSRVWVITPRPSCPPGAYIAAGNKPGGGTADFIWCVWDRRAHSGTEMGWIR
jgi:hypothetical protein